MATKIDELRIEHATALVKRQTAEIEQHARCLQLVAGMIALATAAGLVMNQLSSWRCRLDRSNRARCGPALPRSGFSGPTTPRLKRVSASVAHISVEPWAVSAIVVIASLGAVAGALIFVGWLTAKYGRRVIDELGQLTDAVRELDEKVRVVRNTAVPAIATAVGTSGLAITGALSPWVGAGAAVGAGLIAYLFAACADDPRAGGLRTLLATAAAMVPVLAIFVGLAVSGRLSGLSAGSLVAFIAVSIIGFAGLMFLVLRGSQMDMERGAPAAGV